MSSTVSLSWVCIQNGFANVDSTMLDVRSLRIAGLTLDLAVGGNFLQWIAFPIVPLNYNTVTSRAINYKHSLSFRAFVLRVYHLQLKRNTLFLDNRYY